MKHNRIVFSLSLIYFEHESLWHQVHELDFKNTDSLISGEVKLILILGQLMVSCRKNFHGKICINSTPLLIIFNQLFGCPRANSGALHFQGVSLTYLILIIALDQKFIKSLVMSLGTEVQLSTSLRFELAIFESEVDVLTHCAYSLVNS